MNDTCLDRLLKQRSALPNPGNPIDFPPQRGGLRSLSVAAVCLATEITEFCRILSPSPTNSWVNIPLTDDYTSGASHSLLR
jgi:hypothetical protein